MNRRARIPHTTLDVNIRTSDIHFFLPPYMVPSKVLYFLFEDIIGVFLGVMQSYLYLQSIYA